MPPPRSSADISDALKQIHGQPRLVQLSADHGSG